MSYSIVEDSINFINKNSQEPYILIILFVLILMILIYYIYFGNFNNSGYNDNNYNIISYIIWGIFIFIILVNGLVFFFNINIFKEVSDIVYMLINDIKDIPDNIEKNIKDISNQVISNKDISNQVIYNQDISNMYLNDSFDSKEVYHLPGQRFSYNDARAVCKSFNSTLASHEQLSDAQKIGASWCSYGWSKDQLALYPTNQKDFDKLQEDENHKYDCGIPGVNGGYISNPYIKLGANCYGYKPKISSLEKEYLNDESRFPKNQKELLFNERVKYWKNRLVNILVSPFNNEKWYKLD